MKSDRRTFLVLSGLALLVVPPLAAQSRRRRKARSKPSPKPAPAPPLEEGVAAKLDFATGSLPGGATPVAGQWVVDAGAKRLKALPEPILDAWLEFGPEIREKGATLVATGLAPGGGRLKSRIGAGLYGKNGFQIRLVPARQEVELVRRGEVLLRKPFEIDPEKLHSMELSVAGERQHWIVSGRVWTEEGQRPDQTLFDHKVFAAELEFPLAGRSVLFATPFSGEPVAFASAVVRYGSPAEG